MFVLSDLNGEEIVETFYEKELQKTNEKEFRVKKVIKRKGDELYVKWKDYNIPLTVGLKKETQYKCNNILLNLLLWQECKN